MVHWPKSNVGRVMTIVIALIVGLGLVQSAIALSGTFVWITLAVAALAVFVAVVVHRRAQEASDLALADAPSFADVLPEWNHRKDLEAAKAGRGTNLDRTPRPVPPGAPAPQARRVPPSRSDVVRRTEGDQNSGPVSVNRTASPPATKNPHSASDAPSSATFR